ncbi:hypothetical protein QNH23_04465 [Siminovitchia fortis]|uniref:Uncharacterized protein n=1 Tax=Siminovitchia fortis TaxID=254758 RepID=A0A443J4G7_9BACI|nr:hypothetical protein [Siminovitchia fortis]RWR15213.1 hypothetical protein D4N35_001360 [Siminovitchia fortis]WHY82646.1 hypothetical protein QNH23_04465 [Siminovitchia fortis]
MRGTSININIFMLKINSFENASAVNIGQSLLADWNNHDKKTQGFGQNLGDDVAFLSPQSFVDDRYLVDSPSTFNALPMKRGKG